MTQETGTLAELNVQPGDVVMIVGDDEHMIVKECPPREAFYADHWDMEGRAGLYRDGQWTLISRAALPYGHARLADGTLWDMTAERQYPFGMLTVEQQAAMQAHGGPWQWWSGIWNNRSDPQWLNSTTYRVTPKPKRETVTWDMRGLPDGRILQFCSAGEPVTVTYEAVDGAIDWSTYRVEPRK